MKISAFMTVFEEDQYLIKSIKSVIDYVDELVIIDKTNKLKLEQNSKIIVITANNYDPYHLSHQKALRNTYNEWVLKWDSDFIANDNFAEFIQFTKQKEQENYDGVIVTVPIIYGTANKIHKNKTQSFLCRKRYLLITSHEITFNTIGRFYLTDIHYFISIKFDDHKLLYHNFKDEYWNWILKTPDEQRLSFREFLEKILNKNYENELIVIKQNLINITVAHNYELPTIIGIVKENPIEKPIEKPIDKPVVKPIEKPSEKPIDKPVVKPNDKHVEKPVVKPNDKPVEKPVVKPSEKPVVKPIEKHVEKIVEKAVEKQVEKPINEKPIVEKLLDKVKPKEKTKEKSKEKIKEKPKEKKSKQKLEVPPIKLDIKPQKLVSDQRTSLSVTPEPGNPSSPKSPFDTTSVTKTTSSYALSELTYEVSSRRKSLPSNSRKELLENVVRFASLTTSGCVTKEIIHDYQMTIIIYVRNSAYLKYAVESVLNQSSNKWKLIIINDTEQSLPTTFVHDKIKVIENKYWLGSIKSHQHAISLIDTEIIGFLNSNDALDPSTVESILNIYNTMNDDVFIYSNFWQCDIDLYKKAPGNSAMIKNSILLDDCINNFMTLKKENYQTCISPQKLITVNEDADEIVFNSLSNGYDDDFINGYEHQDLLIQLEKFAKPCFIDKYFYLQRQTHDGSSLLSKYLRQLSVIKNIYRRHGKFNPVLIIYSTRSEEIENYVKSKSYSLYGDSKTIINFAKYYFEIWSGDIYFGTIDYEANKEFLKQNLNSNEISIKLTWDNNINSDFNSWKISSGLSFYEDFVSFTPNSYFDRVYYVGEEDINSNSVLEYTKIKFSYHKMNSYAEVAIHAKNNNYQKILVINCPVKENIGFKENFNKLIRSIPYDWTMLYLSSCSGKSLPNNSNVLRDATSNDFTAIGFDASLFDKLTMIGRIIKISGRSMSLTGSIKGTEVIRFLDKYANTSYGYNESILSCK